MRKGLQLALLTVAIGLISVQAMANAPVIGNIPSPIVGNAEPATDGGNFIFMDAMDLNTLATDDSTPSNQLMWTYFETATPSSHGYYLINGDLPINPATANITSPTTSQIINRTIGKGPAGTKLEWNPDAQANTITIRNQYLSALGSGSTVDEGWADGLIAAEQQTVTFFCSDGTSYSSKTVQFYSTNNDFDRLSGNLWIPLKNEPPKASGSTAWKAESWSAGVTSSTWAGGSTGLCIIAPLTGSNVADFASPAPYFSLSKNQVYRIKMQMNSTQGTLGKTPLWDLVLENTNPAGTYGLMAYSMDTMFYDDPYNGGMNTVINTQSGDWKTLYWTPNAVQTDQWNAGVYLTKYDGKRDPRLRFRVLDVDGVGMGQTKSGAICIQSISVDSVPLSRVRVLSNVVNIANGGIKAANSSSTGNLEVQSLVSASHITVTYAKGAVTIKPTTTVVPNTYGTASSTGQQFELTEIHPATLSDNFADSIDNWPITWTTASTADPNIYMMQVGMSAPSAIDAQHPWDAIFLSMYSRTYEMLVDTYVTSRDLLSSPAYTTDGSGNITPQTFTMFFQAGKGTAASNQVNARFKWSIRLANSPAVFFPSSVPGTDPVNTGAVTIHSVKLDKVDFSLH